MILPKHLYTGVSLTCYFTLDYTPLKCCCHKHITSIDRRLPSTFISKKAKQHDKYSRDILCLPNNFHYSRSGGIPIPRSKSTCDMLGRNGLIGKIALKSSMNEGDIMDEIRSVFSIPMKEKKDFQFTILQASGGNSKSLSIPALSASFRWTAGAVAGKSSKMPIYILALEPLDVSAIIATQGQA